MAGEVRGAFRWQPIVHRLMAGGGGNTWEGGDGVGTMNAPLVAGLAGASGRADGASGIGPPRESSVDHLCLGNQGPYRASRQLHQHLPGVVLRTA